MRHVLATAVAAAVTAPALLLSAAPAFADEKPAARTQEAKPTIEELRQAVDRAQKAYDASVTAVADAITLLKEGMEAETYPTTAAVIAAKKTAAAAAQAKTEADQAVVDAQAKLDAATTDEDKAAAQTVLDKAETAAQEAAEAKTAADAGVTEAETAHDDARVAQSRKIGLLQKARDEAKGTLDDAKKALEDAEAGGGEEPGGDCVPAPKLTVGVSGLPDRVTGGSTTTFTLRVTNGTGEKLDAVYPYVFVSAFDDEGVKDLGSYLDLEWSTAADPTWRDADGLEGTSVGSFAPKGSVDVKLRLKAAADVPAGQGAANVSADYINEDGSCGGFPDLDGQIFQIVPKTGTTTPGTTTPGGASETPAPRPGTGNTATEQGGSATTPVTPVTPVTDTTASTTGALADTGASDALPKTGLAAAAALVLGAATMLVSRRRRANADA
ncbi:peptidase [Streptomyces sp. NPDC048182]|uniref:peptidase n=1 Tax=Streptomyces sp. NPDC048182 TaxID=3365507 RepID=UPI00371001C3